MTAEEIDELLKEHHKNAKRKVPKKTEKTVKKAATKKKETTK